MSLTKCFLIQGRYLNFLSHIDFICVGCSELRWLSLDNQCASVFIAADGPDDTECSVCMVSAQQRYGCLILVRN